MRLRFDLARAPRHRLEQRPSDRRVLLHQRAELPRREAVAPAVAGRGDRRRAGAAVDEGDLAEVVAGAERAALLAVDGHGGLAGLDYEEADAARAFVGQLLPFGERALGEVVREGLELLLGEAVKERDVLDQFDGSSHAAILVDARR